MRRSRGAGAALAGLAVAAGAAAWATAGDDRDGARAAASDATATTTVAARRRDLVEREDVEGRLGFAAARTLTAPVAGTVTRLRREGTTVRRGKSLLSVDARATAHLLYGRIPMYRDLHAGIQNGRDVRQLERNLSALGYDPGRVDTAWTANTTAAVRAWEGDRGDRRDGVVERGEVVVHDGAVRVGEHLAGVGEQVRPGAPVARLTGRRPVVTARLDAARQADVHRGDAVDVMLPDGTSAPARVTRVGRVARAGAEGEAATVELRVALRGRRARRGALDGAPVTVGVAVVRTRGALAVPVTALVATAPGRYAVEVSAAGGRRLAGVRLGAFADGWVQVEGRGLRPGTRVVVPR